MSGVVTFEFYTHLKVQVGINHFLSLQVLYAQTVAADKITSIVTVYKHNRSAI